MTSRDEMIYCVVDSNRGIYAGEYLADTQPEWFQYDGGEDDRQILLQGPDHPDYIEAYAGVIDHGTATDVDGKSPGKKWYLYQNIDTFAVREDLPDDDEIYI